jgi:ATP phosphoribosyltransferase regulatory subunit
VAIFRSLVRKAGLSADQERVLFGTLQRKALPETRGCLEEYGVTEAVRIMLLALGELNGGEGVLEEADRVLAPAGDDVQQALETLHQIAAAIQHRAPDIPINFDLGELRGYHYHTGVVFAAYVPGMGQEIGRGGRYDEIGRVFGRSRPATGFSTDVKTLLEVGSVHDGVPPGIYAPCADDPSLDALVADLRARGSRVIRALTVADPNPRALGCDRVLAMEDGDWKVVPVRDTKKSNGRCGS